MTLRAEPPGGESVDPSRGIRTSVEPKQLVTSGYEAIAGSYTGQRAEDSDDIRLVRIFASRVGKGSRVLDAGCGGGKPVARILSEEVRMTGLDLARAQLRLFRTGVPTADAVRGDMVRLPFRDETFAGLVSLYAIIHVPREEHRRLLTEFRRVLRPAGEALVCMGEQDIAGEVAEYMGTRMFWSHFDGPTNRALLAACGFRVLWERTVADFQEPSAMHRFFLIRRP